VTERVLTETDSAEPAIDRLRENAVRAHEVIADGLARRLVNHPDALASLRARVAPSLTLRGFPRSRVFAGMVQEASVAVVCGLTFACSARDRGLIEAQLARVPLLASALDPETVPLAGDDQDDDSGLNLENGPDTESAPGSDEQSLWHELRAMLGSFHDGASPCRDDTHHFSPLLHDLPPELDLSDRALKKALFITRGPYGCRGEPVGGPVRGIDYASVAIRSLGDMYEAVISGSPYGGSRYGAKRNVSERDGNSRRSDAGNRSRTSGRKAAGMYYTPDVIVQYIVSGALDRLVGGGGDRAYPADEPLSVPSILNLKVLDPASGSGHFLLASAEYLARACVAALVRDGKIKDDEPERARALDKYRRIVAERCIYGVDLDPMAVELAGLSLWLFASDPGTPLSVAARHLRCGNSLHRFHWVEEFPDASKGFDAVIGNPPYLSFSGRQKPRGNEWIKHLDSKSKPGGWLTMHGLFMLKSVELAKTSGLVSMVVPDQVGHLKGYGALRRRMLEQGHLLEVRYWGEDVFVGVTSPALTFIVRKSRQPSGWDVNAQDRLPGAAESRDTEVQTASARDAAACDTVMIDEEGSVARFAALPGQEWFTSPSREVFHQMSAIHTALKEFSVPGVHTGNVARKLVLVRPAGGSVPLLEGRQIHPFRCEKPRRWLDLSYRPGAGEYFRVSAEEVYQSTGIILRQTASRPVAARHVFRCHFRNSILALKVPEGFSVEYLLGVLNSAAAGFLYRACSFESRQRTFPQVKVGLLRSLPVPDPRLGANRSRVSEVEELVRRIENAADPDGAPANLMPRLDRLVWSLYGLSDRSLAEPSGTP